MSQLAYSQGKKFSHATSKQEISRDVYLIMYMILFLVKLTSLKIIMKKKKNEEFFW